MCDECVLKQKSVLNVILAIVADSGSKAESVLQIQHLAFFLDALDQAEQTEHPLTEPPLPHQAVSTIPSGQTEISH